MINVIPQDDWIEHKHSEKCVCRPDVHLHGGNITALFHYNVPQEGQYMCDVFEDDELVDTTLIRRNVG